jgi:hypothetical protein
MPAPNRQILKALTVNVSASCERLTENVLNAYLNRLHLMPLTYEQLLTVTV